MIIDIFEIQEDRVIPTINCHNIPQLKAILDKYKNPIPPLCYIHYLTYPRSVYINLPEVEKEETILYDYPGEYSPEDKEIQEAISKLNSLYMTPTRRFYFQNKKALENMGNYNATAEITAGMHGNYSALSMNLTRTGKIMEEFRKLEKMYEEETQSSIRGGWASSYDEK